METFSLLFSVCLYVPVLYFYCTGRKISERCQSQTNFAETCVQNVFS